MMRIPLLILMFSSLYLFTGCSPAPDLEEEKIELLRIHLADIQAHTDGKVSALMETIPEEFIYLGDGEITRQSREEIRKFFTAYLADSTYERYEDLEVPHAEVSADGTMGWVVSRMAVTRTEPADDGGRQTRSFTYAGIMTYEKVDGKWMKVANASTFKR